MSIVVLQELLAGAEDDSKIQDLERVKREYAKAGHLLVPTLDDWWEVGKVINSLQRGRRPKKRGSKKARAIPKVSPQEKYRITNDVLIARTARRAGVTLVTDNMDEFHKIQTFCNVNLISGSEYFKPPR